MTRRVLRGLALVSLPVTFLANCSKEFPTAPRIVSIVAVDGLGQSGIVGGLLSQPLVVRAVDQSGSPVAGAVVTWAVVAGGGQVTPDQSTTAADGLAQATFRLGSLLGSQSARAQLQGAQPVLFSATATSAPPSQLTVMGGDNQTAAVKAALPVQLAVKVSDAFSNPKAGVTVVFTVTLGGGTLTAPTAVSNAAGIATMGWTLGTASGTQRVSAVVAGVVPVSFNATATPGPASRVAIAGGNNQAAPPGSQLPDSLVVRVYDQYDNPVPNVTVAWSPVGDAGQVSPATTVSDASGRAAASWTLSAGGGPKSARATVNALAPASFSAAGTIVFASISAGGHTCALDEAGVLYCWGSNSDGQLGLGQVQGGPLFPVPQRTSLAATVAFAGVDAGAFHSCAPSLSFDPYCWGKNNDGRLGDQSTTQRNSPTRVSGPNVFATMDAGGTHSCGLTAGGRVYCWGSNAEGQLGQGGAINSPAYLSTPAGVNVAVNHVSVAAGGLHSCAVTTAGAALCWGHNLSGQLGNGTMTGSTLPVAVSSGTLFAAITAGGGHTCALTAAGAAWCWGNNSNGQLGNGGTTSSSVPVAVSGGLAFARLSAGENHTCGVTAAGVAYCWGQNSSGQIGNGGTTQATTPVPVGGGLSFASLSAGTKHTCGVTPGRVAYCWGDNQFGQLGDGSMVNRSLPTKVAFQP